MAGLSSTLLSSFDSSNPVNKDIHSVSMPTSVDRFSTLQFDVV